MRRNTMGRIEYIWDNIYWHSLVVLFYYTALFRPILDLNNGQSALVLFGSALASCVISILLTYKQHRNYSTILCNSALCCGVYFLITYWGIARKTLIVAGIFTGIVIAGYCVLVWNSYQHREGPASCRSSAQQWIVSCLHRCRKIVALILALLIIGMMLLPVFGISVTDKADTAEETRPVAWEDGETISKNMETVLLLQEEEWDKLDTDARLAVMQTIADIEANYLGIPQVKVCAETIEDEGVVGTYVDCDRTITLDLEYLSDSEASEALEVLCHECRHAYQYSLVELYDATHGKNRHLLVLRQAADYKEEFAYYIDGDDDFESYNTQSCEVDSDEYAREAVYDYYWRIYMYTEELDGEPIE